MAQVSQAIDGIQASVSQLHGMFSDLTSAYQTQIVAETQLQTIMQQRMKATDADIQSIKELCAAQQKLGVVGDEVAISGAQQMATFLKEKESLDLLVPAMNNLLAQQKGLNATSQDAVSIGNMMGKALQGSVDVLQRVGISFNDAQKEVLQYGTESEKAAILADVIRDNVGEMNAALAATDAGKQKQLENTLGDIKESFGEITQKAMPMLTVFAQISNAATGMMRLQTSVKAVMASVTAKTTAINKDTVAVASNTTAIRSSTRISQIHQQMLVKLTSVTGSLTVSTIALTAAYTMGLSLAISGMCILFNKLSNNTQEVTDKQDILSDSTQSFSNSLSEEIGRAHV